MILKNISRLLLAICLVAVSFLPSALSAQEAEGEPIVLGVGAPFTGPNAQFGVQIRRGLDQGVREINADGGINGRPVKLVFGDDAGMQTEANKVALKLSGNDDLMAVIGHFNSSCSLAGRGIYNNAGLVMFSPASTNAQVTLGHDNVFRNIFSDKFQGYTLATLVKNDLGFDRVAVLHDNDDYGNGLKDFMTEKAEEIGLELVDVKAYDRETTDFRPTLKAMMKRKPQAIVIAGLYQQAGFITKQVRELRIPLPIVASDGVFSEKYIELAGPSATNALITCPFIFEESNERAMAFFNAVKAETGQEPDAWAALSYDAMMMIVQVIKNGATTREEIQAALAEIDTPEEAFDGITGKTYFDENGDCLKEVFIAQVKDGKFVGYKK